MNRPHPVSPVRTVGLLKGRRLPALKTLLDLPTVSWATVSAAWYDGTTAVGTHLANGPLGQAAGTRWVLVRDPHRGLALQSVGGPDAWRFVLRWELEVKVRAHLGVEEWSDQAIARTTPRWASSPGPPWRPICCGNNDPRPIAQRLGTPSRRRPSWMHRPGAPAPVAGPRVFHCPPPTLIYGKSRPPCNRLIDSLAYAA